MKYLKTYEGYKKIERFNEARVDPDSIKELKQFYEEYDKHDKQCFKSTY